MNFTQIYDLIGCTGVVLFIVGIAAVYITVWNIIYLRGVLRSFKQSFRGMENTTAERIRRAYGKSTNPLICIVRDVVTTHAAHSEDIRAEVAYLFHKNFKPVNNALTWLKLIAAVSRCSDCLAPFLVWFVYSERLRRTFLLIRPCSRPAFGRRL